MSTSTIHIDELLDSNPIGRLQWRVVVLCFVLAVIDGFDAQIIAYVAPLIADQFALSPDVMGQLYSSALLGLMAGALIGSPVADRIGRKPVILVSATTAARSVRPPSTAWPIPAYASTASMPRPRVPPRAQAS